MKRSIYLHLSLIGIFALMFSCNETEISDAEEEKSIISTDERITLSSLDLGVYRYSSSARIVSNETSFELSGTEVRINGERVNLSGKTVRLSSAEDTIQIYIDVFDRKYSLIVNTENKEVALIVSNRKTKLNNDIIRSLSQKDHVALFIMLSILADRTSHKSERFIGSEFSNAKKEVSYITMSAGMSQTSAGSNLDSYNKSEETGLISHGCVKNGRNYGCVVGEAICVAIDHWVCDSDPGFNVS